MKQVKKLEELGIGRPSTYASTLKVLQVIYYWILSALHLSCQRNGHASHNMVLTLQYIRTTRGGYVKQVRNRG